MVKLLRITKNKRDGRILNKEYLDGELVDYNGNSAYKVQEYEKGPHGYFPVERLGRQFDISKTKVVETILA